MQTILIKVYRLSSIVIVPVILSLCLVCRWPVLSVSLAILASIVVSSPATICLHIMMWLSRKANLERCFAWMVLLASIPMFSLLAVWLFAPYVPGKIWFLVPLVMFSGYVGILTNAFSVVQVLNPIQNEREEYNTID